ncbi:MAG: alpha/beta hydrolase [Terrimicrobiaceae bacterium]
MGILIFLLLLGYGVITAAVYFHQDAMIFFPSRQSSEEGDRLAVRNGFEPWRNPQGLQIGWQSLEGEPTNSLLVLHGNAGNALHRAYYHQYSRQAGKWKTYLLEYPGYGARAGQPTEESLTLSGLEAVDVLSALPDRKIWMLGESLGSGVAAAVAARRKERVSGLILVTPFDSLVNAARNHYPWLPVSALMRTRFESDKHLAAYPGPAAFVVAEKDSVVPAALGKKLYNEYPGRKQLWVAPGSGHDVSAFLATDWPLIVNFLTGG